jgi:hypothetical protein
MNYRRHLKETAMLIVDCNASPTTIILKLSKSQIVRLLDYVFPDDDSEVHELSWLNTLRREPETILGQRMGPYLQGYCQRSEMENVHIPGLHSCARCHVGTFVVREERM